eukprot:TRINITY_DN35771_c0_g2_i1.p1 TRINITY_DN35771_c0_g2~~TRINITY_DN35771_c0_g2_i1.p1  ORF type:complete len:2134 (+),score=468.58 TRINITY_DN35771_c0_g2_i1:176-6403(+)
MSTGPQQDCFSVERKLSVATAATKQSSLTTLESLSQRLMACVQQDHTILQTALSCINELAGKGPPLEWLHQYCAHRGSMDFTVAAAALLAAEPGSSQALLELRPEWTQQDADVALGQAIAVILCSLRMGQTRSALRLVTDLIDAVTREAAEVVLQHGEAALAGVIGLRRGYGDPQAFDPRLLVFEFISGFMLSASQLRILAAFQQHISTGQSLCQQLIMGDGKTTCLMPLLGMLLTSQRAEDNRGPPVSRLVCCCVPRTLLPTTRQVLVERFSTPVLQKAIHVFECTRNTKPSMTLVRKVEAVRDSQSLLLASARSLKSLLLKQVLLLNQLDEHRRASGQKASDGLFSKVSCLSMNGSKKPPGCPILEPDEEASKITELRLNSQIIDVVHGGIMIMDEVDMLLCPLKAELNWPFGPKFCLDLTEGESNGTGKGLRHRLPYHLLDGVFVAMGFPMTMPYEDKRDAQDALAALQADLMEGHISSKICISPHLVLVCRDFYDEHMLPPLAEWLTIFIRSYVKGALKKDELTSYLVDPASVPPAAFTKLKKASDMCLKVLNLSLKWLHVLLPHLLMHIHKVHYGLVVGEKLEQQYEDTFCPKSRKLLAVPFDGLDTPSAAAEFSDPEVAIGFTILAYRYNGLRKRDLETLLQILQDHSESENSRRPYRRAANQAFVSMVIETGHTVRGFTEDGQFMGDLSHGERLAKRQEAAERRQVAKNVAAEAMAAAAKAGLHAGASEAAMHQDVRLEVKPLECVDLTDGDQLLELYFVLKGSAQAVKYLLEESVLRPHSDALDGHASSMHVCGQELAGPQLFRQCFALSGTPNELLPLSMGQCIFAEADIGTVFQRLGDPNTVAVHTVGEWSPQVLLDVIAMATDAGEQGSKYHALIDCGALITGLSGAQVAEHLLVRGLPDKQGVVFIDEKDTKVCMLRDGFRVTTLAQCGLPASKRFTYYDQTHCAGVDIDHPLFCHAAITIGKDTTLRDYAVAAYRMRGIGKGQHLHLYLITEVLQLVHHTLAHAEKRPVEERADELQVLQASDEGRWQQEILSDILCVTFLNGMRIDERRHVLLCQQNLQDLWRKAAFKHLETAPFQATSETDPDGRDAIHAWLGQEKTKIALNELRSRIDHTIPNRCGHRTGSSLAHHMEKELADHMSDPVCIWEDARSKNEAAKAAEKIMLELAPDAGGTTGKLAQDDAEVIAMEREHEKEQDLAELEDEAKPPEAAELTPEDPVDRIYAKDDLVIRQPWKLAVLTEDWTLQTNDHPFYPMGDWLVNTQIKAVNMDEAVASAPFVLGAETGSSPQQQPAGGTASGGDLPTGGTGQNEDVTAADASREPQVDEEASREKKTLRGLQDFAMISEGYYPRRWSTSGSIRRLRNFICFLEWVPDVSKVERLSVGAALSEKQLDALRQAYNELHVEGGDGGMSLDELRVLLHDLEFDHEGDILLKHLEEEGGEPCLADIEKTIQSPEFFKMQKGRYFVALSLEEAEHLRGSMHLAKMNPEKWPPGCFLALRCIQNLDSVLGDSLIEEVGRCVESAELPYQREVMESLVRFGSSTPHLDARGLNILIRTMQETAPEERCAWWLNVRSCRRRAQVPWEQLPISKVLSSSDVMESIVQQALISRIKWALVARRLDPMDAFRALDVDGNEILSKGELVRGLAWLGVKSMQPGSGAARWTQQLDALFACMDVDAGGYLSIEEFTDALELTDLDYASVPDSMREQMAKEPLSVDGPGSAPEEEAGGSEGAQVPKLTGSMLTKLAAGRFRLQWVELSVFKEIWSTIGTVAEKSISLWDIDVTALKSARGKVVMQVILGHALVVGTHAPARMPVLEVADLDQSGAFKENLQEDLKNMIDTYFPHPMGYRQVWELQPAGPNARPLSVWEPLVPSEAFVAVGMVATATTLAGGGEPSPELVRCVPKAWTQDSGGNVERFWTDMGGGGVPASFWVSGAPPSLPPPQQPGAAHNGPAATATATAAATAARRRSSAAARLSAASRASASAVPGTAQAGSSFFAWARNIADAVESAVGIGGAGEEMGQLFWTTSGDQAHDRPAMVYMARGDTFFLADIPKVDEAAVQAP